MLFHHFSMVERKSKYMCELEMEDLVNKINACTEDEKRVILSQIAGKNITLFIEAIILEIGRLKTVEEKLKGIFGV